MNRFARCGLVLVLCAILAIAPGYAETAASYSQLYESLWSTVNEHFYDPHFKGVDWKGVKERFRERAEAIEDDAQFASLASEMLAEIPSSHLHIVVPERNVRTTGIAARITTIDGVPVVADVAALSDAHRQGLRPGDRLLSPPSALRGKLGSAAAVKVERCDGEEGELRIRREQAWWPPEGPGFRWSQIRVRPDTTIGYLDIGRFDDGAAELADRAMSQLMESQALIIDLRNNSGGNASALRLASYFGNGAEPAVILFARSYLEELGRPVSEADVLAAPRIDAAYTDEAVFEAISANGGGAAFWTEEIPQKYERPVYVLVGEETGSAAEGFAWYMRERTHAVLIGRVTAGALLSSETFEIGEGWSVVVPVHGLWGTDGTDYGDRAVPPDKKVAWMRDDLCSGRDPDVETALSLAMGEQGERTSSK
jgi:carboxyl-terminal processing protease